MILPSKQQQCSFSLDKSINAPLHLVWSIVRQFNNPKLYKTFIRSCFVHSTSLRTITHVTGFPATTSVERLDFLDDDTHVMVFSLIGGDQSLRLANYQGTISVHEEDDDHNKRTIVREKYTVDVPEDSNEEDTKAFVDTLVGLNLKSLACVAERLVTVT